MELLNLTLEPAGARLDRALTTAYPTLSRAQWQRLIKEGQVTLQGQRVKGSQKLEGGEVVQVVLPDPKPIHLVPENIPLDVRYEDDDLLVINKRAGMVVHPGTGHETGTIVHAVLHHCPDLPGIGGEIRPGIVHRLDKDTSGLLIVAKNEPALKYMQAQFKERTIKKVYLALTEGQVNPPQALIDAPLGRDPSMRKKMTVIRPGSSARSRASQTRYETTGSYDEHTLVTCYPHTGRTHQIRVHLAYIGYPIVGDAVYGRRKQPLLQHRHFLHAHKLTFRRPSDGEEMSLVAEMPADLQSVVDRVSGEKAALAPDDPSEAWESFTA